jgi:hypothetical protein
MISFSEIAAQSAQCVEPLLHPAVELARRTTRPALPRGPRRTTLCRCGKRVEGAEIARWDGGYTLQITCPRCQLTTKKTVQTRASRSPIENPLTLTEISKKGKVVEAERPSFRPYPEFFENCVTLQDYARAAREAEYQWIGEHRYMSKWPPALEPRNAKR